MIPYLSSSGFSCSAGAPGNGTFTVLLGLAGYGDALFDDLRVEVVEQDDAMAACPTWSDGAIRPGR